MVFGAFNMGNPGGRMAQAGIPKTRPPHPDPDLGSEVGTIVLGFAVRLN